MPHTKVMDTTATIAPLLAPAPALPHYETAEVTQRPFEHGGRRWLAIYISRHDGIGWLVQSVTVMRLPDVLQRRAA